MNKKQQKAAQRIADGTGDNCPRCGTLMRRWRHPPGWQPPRGNRCFFEFWDECQNQACRTTLVMPKAGLRFVHQITQPDKPAPAQRMPRRYTDPHRAKLQFFASMAARSLQLPDQIQAAEVVDDDLPPWEVDEAANAAHFRSL